MVIDCHAHIFPEHVADRAMEALGARYGIGPVARPVPDELVRVMDRDGVDRAIAVAVATRPAQVTSINDWLLNLGQPRLIPFGALHPHYEDIPGEVQRLLDAGIKGVKLQPHFQDYTLDDPATLRMFEAIGERLVVLLHGGNEIIPIPDVQPTPPRLLALHRQFPQVRFILAHLGGSGLWDGVEEYLVGEDVYFDASYVFDICSDEQIERIIRNHGPQRIVWGSDFPWQTPAQGLRGVARLGLTDEQKSGILGGNLAQLLDL